LEPIFFILNAERHSSFQQHILKSSPSSQGQTATASTVTRFPFLPADDHISPPPVITSVVRADRFQADDDLSPPEKHRRLFFSRMAETFSSSVVLTGTKFFVAIFRSIRIPPSLVGSIGWTFPVSDLAPRSKGGGKVPLPS